MNINLEADLNSTLEAMKDSDLCIVKQYRKLQADYDLLKIQYPQTEGPPGFVLLLWDWRFPVFPQA